MSNIPSFFPLLPHGLPSSCKHRAVCIPHPLAGCGEAPLKSEIAEQQTSSALAHATKPYQSQVLQDSLLHLGDRGALPALAGAGAGRFWGLTAPWHGMQAGKKSGILACDIDLVSSERVNEIHTSFKTSQVGSIGLFHQKKANFSSENNFFRKPSSIAKSFLSSAVELFEKQPRLSCSERLFSFPGVGRALVPLNQVRRGKIITM